MSFAGCKTEKKIVSWEQARLLAARVGAVGGRLVFTNGCFDLLHWGHVKLLEQARVLGEALVVGLNSDASVRRLKGVGRPVIPQGQRAYILAALHCVDRVVLFDEDTPVRLLHVLRPQVLVKGGDYRPEQVVGRAAVESWGGRVVLVPLQEGVSTSAIVEELHRKGQ